MEALDTICALSTARQKAALGIIRVSGPESKRILESLVGEDLNIRPREAKLVRLKAASGQVLDEAIAIYYQAPRSFTGEEMLELICHGNPLLLDRILEEIVSRGTRRAEAGEFSKRALAHGKMSLSQLESLEVLLNADHQKALEIGIRSFHSRFELKLESLSDSLQELLVQIQSQLDFPEHEVGDFSEESCKKAISALKRELLRWMKAFESYRSYLGKQRVLLLGPPNAGKSSLFNALIGYEKAIVFDQPGTTRDRIDHILEKKGFEIQLVDTAGIREVPDAIEKIGIDKALELLPEANLIIWVSDEAIEPPEDLKARSPQARWVLVQSKSDLGRPIRRSWLPVSIYRPEEFQALEELIFETPKEVGEEVWIVSERQYSHISSAVQHLDEALKRLESGMPLEWVAQAVLDSSASLENLVGKIPPEDVLKSILSRFCIGK